MTRLLLASLLTLAAGSVQAQALPPASASRPSPAKPPTAARAAPAGPADAATPEEIFAEWDTDKNKQLSVAEFKAGVEKARLQEVLARLEQQFRKADTNGNKKIEASEYAQLPVIKRGGASAPAFASFDTNKDGGLDPQEYIDMVQSFLRRSGGAN